MSVKVQHALFELIKSMTKSEKRYFKVLSSRHTIGEENNYVVLFDFIDQMDTYDEEIVHDHFKGEAFLNRFTITKKRLYDHILNALDAYHAEKSQTAQLLKQVHSAEILFNKSLYDQCRRVLISAEKQAEKLHNELVLAMILDQKKRLFETIGYEEVGLKDEVQLLEKYSTTLQRMSYINELWGIKSKLFRQIVTKGVSRCAEDVRSYNEICTPINEVLKLNELNAEGIYLINHIRSAQKYAIGEFEQSFHFLEKNLNHFEMNDAFRIQEPQKFISVLTNAIYIADRLGKHNAALQLLAKLKSEVSSMELSPDLEVKVFATQESIQLSLDMRMGRVTDIIKRKDQINDRLRRYNDKINPARKAFVQYKLALASFVSGDFSDCVKALNDIIQVSVAHNNEELIRFSYILELLCMLELGKDDLLAYKLKSFERLTKKNSRFEKIEGMLLVFLRSWLKTSSQLDRLDDLENFNHSMLQLKEEESSSESILEYFDFLAWSKAKLENKTMDVCIKERYNASIRNAS